MKGLYLNSNARPNRHSPIESIGFTYLLICHQELIQKNYSSWIQQLDLSFCLPRSCQGFFQYFKVKVSMSCVLLQVHTQIPKEGYYVVIMFCPTPCISNISRKKIFDMFLSLSTKECRMYTGPSKRNTIQVVL